MAIAEATMRYVNAFSFRSHLTLPEILAVVRGLYARAVASSSGS